MTNELIADGIYRVSGMETSLKNGAWVSDAGTYLVTNQTKLAEIPEARPGDIAFTAGYGHIWQLDVDSTTWVELPKTAAGTAATQAAASATAAAGSASAAAASASQAQTVAASIPADYTELSNSVVDLKSAIAPVIVSNAFTTNGLTTGRVLNENGSDKATTTGAYTAIIPVESGETYKLAFTFSNPSSWAVRILGYISGSFDAQIALVNTSSSGSFSTDIEIPSTVDGIKISFYKYTTINGDVALTKYVDDYSGVTAIDNYAREQIAPMQATLEDISETITNIYTSVGITEGKILNANTGNPQDGSRGAYTALLPVTSGKGYTLSFDYPSGLGNWSASIHGYTDGVWDSRIGAVNCVNAGGTAKGFFVAPDGINGIKISFYMYRSGSTAPITYYLENITLLQGNGSYIGTTAYDHIARNQLNAEMSNVGSAIGEIWDYTTAPYLANALRNKTKKPDELIHQLRNVIIPNDVTISHTISIPNNGEQAMKDCVVRLGLHKGTRDGDNVYDEIWDANFRDDFSGLRFLDANNQELKYQIVSYGNYDFVPDSKLACFSDSAIRVLSDNSIVKSLSGEILVSRDNGSTWTKLTDFQGFVVFVDSNDNLYAQKSNKIYRLAASDDYDVNDAVMVLDLSADSGTIQGKGCAELSSGTIIFGAYQDGTQDKPTLTYSPGATIYRSTDGGLTFSVAYHDDHKQHVHQIFVDRRESATYGERIYAGLDDSMSRHGPDCIASDDDGVTWTQVEVPYRNRDYFPCYVGGPREAGFMLGGGEANILGGDTLYRTNTPYDYENYHIVLNNHSGLRTVFGTDDCMFAGTTAGHSNKLHQIYQSTDQGLNWTPVYIDKHKGLNYSGAGGGTRFVTPYFTPMGATENQYIISGFGMDSPLRCFVGGDRHYACVLVYLDTIPVGGTEITLVGNKAISTSQELFNTYDKPIYTVNLNEGWGNVTNGLTFQSRPISGLKAWEMIRDIPALVNDSRDFTSYGAVLAEDAYIQLPRVPLNRSKNLSFSFWVKMPEDPNVLFDNNSIIYTLFCAGPYEICIRGANIYIYYGANHTKQSHINFPDRAIYSGGMWRLIFVTVGNESMPILHDYYYDKLSSTKDTAEENYEELSLQTFNASIGKESYGENSKCWPYGLSDIRIYDRELTHPEIVRIMNGYGFATSDFT